MNQEAIYWRGLLELVMMELLTNGVLSEETKNKAMKALKEVELWTMELKPF